MDDIATSSLAKGPRPDLRLSMWTLLALIYLVLRFAFTRQLDELGAYASYIFEVADVAIVVGLSGRAFLNYFSNMRPLARPILIASLISLVAGFAVFRYAIMSQILIPFDLCGAETLLFLLIVAPILEEFIFRFFLWRPIEWLTKTRTVTWILTTLIFSYSHLHSMWFVPVEIHPFIEYQTAYTLVLGAGCGYFMWRANSLAGAIAVHFCFNLGFYLGSFV